MTPDVDVVILHEDELVAQLPVAHQLRNLLQDPLARIVARMRLAGEYKLNRALRIVDHGRQPFDVRQQQIGPLEVAKRRANPMVTLWLMISAPCSKESTTDERRGCPQQGGDYEGLRFGYFPQPKLT
jgi:hypothetical protein